MDVTQIPFNKLLEISRSGCDDNVLELGFTDNKKNHLGTFHAGAQFSLAEACSGLALQKNFPHLAYSVIPVLRKTDIQFKKPAPSTLFCPRQHRKYNGHHINTDSF